MVLEYLGSLLQHLHLAVTFGPTVAVTLYLYLNRRKFTVSQRIDSEPFTTPASTHRALLVLTTPGLGPHSDTDSSTSSLSVVRTVSVSVRDRRTHTLRRATFQNP